MDFQYVAYTANKRLIKGRISAANEEAATNALNYGGAWVVSLKTVVPFFTMGRLTTHVSRIKPKEVIMFSRQLAILLESGSDIVNALELLQRQSSNKIFNRIIGEIVSDIRGGSLLSTALSKHPETFSEIYHRTIAAGEHGGNLDTVLRQMADFLERSMTTQKKIKNALTYPFILAIVAAAVIIILVTFVMPTFSSLYASFNVELPLPTRMLLGTTEWLFRYGLYLLLAIIAAVAIGYLYLRTPAGKYKRDKLMLRLPLLGRIIQTSELSRCCRTMALLFKVGLPVPEIVSMAIHSTSNKVISEALSEVQQELIRGHGLSKPMANRTIFLPLMVQMVAAGEETGNLDSALNTVAQSFEVEADDKTSAAVGLIQPAMVVAIALVIGFIAIALLTSMYSIYGSISF